MCDSYIWMRRGNGGGFLTTARPATSWGYCSISVAAVRRRNVWMDNRWSTTTADRQNVCYLPPHNYTHHTPILFSLSGLCSHVAQDIKSTWLFNKRGGVSYWWLHGITFAVLCVCLCLWEWEQEREGGLGGWGVGTAAVAWGEVLPWFSVEFLCFWKPERGKLNLRSPGVSAPWEFSAHISLPPALMVLGVALFSKLGTAKVFFTFQKKESGGKKRWLHQAKRLWPGGTRTFAPYFQATDMKGNYRFCHSVHKRYLPVNMDGEHKQKEHFLYFKKSVVQQFPNVSICNDPPLQINKLFNCVSWPLEGPRLLQKCCQLLLQAGDVTLHSWLIKSDKPRVMVLKLYKGISVYSVPQVFRDQILIWGAVALSN